MKKENPGARFFSASINIYSFLVFFFLSAPLLVVAILSFISASYLQFPPPGYSLRWYAEYFSSPNWIRATINSLKIALGTTLLATFLGTLAAFSLVRGKYRLKPLADRLIAAPIVVPNIIIAVAIYALFSNLRIIGTWYGVVVGHTIYAIPFVAMVVGAALRTVDIRLELAAESLGASKLGAIRLVTLPLIKPAVVSAAFLAFITSFDELIIALFISGSQVTLPKKMYENIIFEIDPVIAAVSVLQTLLVGAFLYLASRYGQGMSPVPEGS